MKAFLFKRSSLYDIRVCEYFNRVWLDAKWSLLLTSLLGALGFLPFVMAKQVANGGMIESFAIIGVTLSFLLTIFICGTGLVFRSRKTNFVGRFVIYLYGNVAELAFKSVSWLIGIVLGLSFISVIEGGDYFSAMLVVLFHVMAIHLILIFMTKLINGPIKIKALNFTTALGVGLMMGSLVAGYSFPWMKYITAV